MTASSSAPDGPRHAAVTPAGTVLAVAPGPGTPNAPATAVELADAAANCARVGAAVLDLEPQREPRLAEVIGAVRAHVDLLVRVTTRPRAETLSELLECGADVLVCPLDSPAEFVTELRARAAERAVPVQFEARTPDELMLLRELGLSTPPHVVLHFGTDGGFAGDVHGVASALAHVPRESTFTAVGVGNAHVPVLLTALAAGGCVRTGLADTSDYAEGVAATDNTQLLARAAGLAKIAQRPALGRDETARLFATHRATSDESRMGRDS